MLNGFYAMNGGYTTPNYYQPNIKRYMVPAKAKIHAYNADEDKIHEQIINKDLYFTEDDIIVQQPSDQRYLRVTLKKDAWTWMDIPLTEVFLVNLRPMFQGDVDFNSQAKHTNPVYTTSGISNASGGSGGMSTVNVMSKEQLEMMEDFIKKAVNEVKNSSTPQPVIPPTSTIKNSISSSDDNVIDEKKIKELLGNRSSEWIKRLINK